jgi:predicted transcriptional regulator
MPADDVKRLREELACSIGELAAAVGVDAKTVLAWESGDLFPTKRHSARLEALRRGGPEAIGRLKAEKSPGAPLDRLADPRLWAIVRKLVAHPAFFEQVAKLGESYAEPVQGGER